jgi:hypothetical protein
MDWMSVLIRTLAISQIRDFWGELMMRRKRKDARNIGVIGSATTLRRTLNSMLAL